jgi:hypothetical protein
MGYGGNGAAPRRARNRGWYWLLALPLIGTLIPTIYNTADPRFIGIPFFYWYQMLRIPLSVACTVLVYRRTRGERS